MGASRVRYRVGDRVWWSSVTREPGPTREFAMLVEGITQSVIRLRLLARPDAEGVVRSVCGADAWPFDRSEWHVARRVRDRRRSRRGSVDPLRPEPEMSLSAAEDVLRAEGADLTYHQGDLLVRGERREQGQEQNAWIEPGSGSLWRIRGWRDSSR